MQFDSIIPLGFCQCGCGQKTKIAERNNYRDHWRKGQPILYVNGHNWRTRPTSCARIPLPPDQRFWAKVDKDGPIPLHRPELGQCWVWTGYRTKAGYGRFGMTAQGRGVIQAHIFAWEMSFGAIADGQLVCHKCDNPPCVRPNHLFMGSSLDNVRDMIHKGRQRHIALRGIANPFSKLTDGDVSDIRRLWERGASTKTSLARHYEVGWSTIYDVIAGRTWHHVP